MRGHILVDKEGRRWLYIPEVDIYLFISIGRGDMWVLAAFRSDGYHGRTREEATPTVEYLRNEFQWTSVVEVPQHVADFAVQSERLRQESVEGIEEVLKTASKSTGGLVSWDNFRAFLRSQKPDDPEAEHRIGLEIKKIIEQAGGLQ